MVKLLLRRPGEWLTFRQAAYSLKMPNCDTDVVGALVEFRPDLFSVNNDTRFKLRSGVAESVANIGVAEWQVPARPEAPQHESSEVVSHSATSLPGCYCNVPETRVLQDLIHNSVPDSAIMYTHCWRHIFRARGLYFNHVTEETWREICQRRGYLRERENPRGF
jgi:hypothetical protein